MPLLARMIGIKPQNLVYIIKYCGGGFGSNGSPYSYMALLAHISKKTSTPVMLRISRQGEYALGSARPGFQGRVKLCFTANGKITAADLYIVQDSGLGDGFGDYRSAADSLSLIYQPESMRFRRIQVKTNTPYRGAQRGPGHNQMVVVMKSIMDKVTGN